jgi:predicted small lipoprotein YifL
MIRGNHGLTLALIAIGLFAITACGQMGPLTLPDDTASGEEEQSDEENER